MSTTLFFTILLFLLGLAFILNPGSHEGFTDKDKELNVSCPDILYQKGKEFYLYNSKDEWYNYTNGEWNKIDGEDLKVLKNLEQIF